ncbi:AMP-binding protein [Allopusillimonas ginsengisoli]|uniref:AMP-binding protein n=1 Tax=Allopusillimonas ginsengisoli TaxID=453575 RepID=UPI00102283E0|nr:AMP-binding protein [Allopusillimonas ginsengisoli]TEA79107.1 2-aminobenzoate-CoA ligase [Allopusillimonas ginsengisoli]
METSAHTDTFARDHLPPVEEWPELLLGGNPDVDYPPRLNCAVALVDERVDQGQGERIAVHWREGSEKHHLKYRELMALTNRIARVLVEDMGLKPGNRILLRGPNNVMMSASWLAAVKAGLVTVPTMPLLRAGELQKVLDKAEISAVLCDHRLADEVAFCMDPQHPAHSPALRQVCYFGNDAPDSLDTLAASKPDTFDAVETAVDDVCLIAFTSGTTGKPKGCMHFHRDVLAMCDTFSRHVLRMSDNDIVCGTPPLAFTFGLGGLLCFPLRVGGSTVLCEKLTPESLLATVQDFGVTMTFTAPTFYRQMAALVAKYDLSSLRATVSAGEALPDATRQLWKEASGIEMIDGIGGTEMIHVYVSSPPEAIRRGAIGKVVPGYVAQVVDDDFRPVAPGQTGRLAVKGPTGCRYLDDERQRRFVQQGWNLPGDTFSMDEDGYLYYQARNDDMIVSAGYNIAGPEVEGTLLAHEAVAECGVVGKPDEQRGNIVKAYVVLKPGYTGDAALVKSLQDYVKATVAPYKYPREIEFVDSLPRTETGKLQRFVLRQKASE